MTNRTEPSSLAWVEICRAQIAVVLLSRRVGITIFLVFLLAQVIALAGFGVVLGVTITTHDDVTEVGMTHVDELYDELGAGPPQAVVALGVAFVLLAGFALFWPFTVWSGERPSRRGYHWSMPVDRRSHDLARVAAGAAVLLGLCLGVYLISILISLGTGTGAGLGAMAPTFWVGLVLGPLVPYALTSIFVVRCEHPAGWFWGGLGALAFASTAAGLLGIGAVNRGLAALMIGRAGLLRAAGGPVWAGFREVLPGGAAAGGLGWWAVWGLWIALLTGAVVLASSVRAASR